MAVSERGDVEEEGSIASFSISTLSTGGSMISDGGKGTGMPGVAEDGKLVKGECDWLRR